MTRDKVFYSVIFGFAIGIFFRSFFNFGAIFWQFLIFLAGAIFAASFFLKNFRQITLAVFILAVGLGIGWFDLSADKGITLDLENKVGQTVLLEGIISAEPDERETSTKLTIDIASTTGKILATVASYPEFNYGDQIHLRGVLQKPKNFTNEDDLRQFDYVSYLAKDGVRYVMFQPTITLISENSGNFVKRKLFDLKNSFLRNVGEIIPEPAASLLGGLVVGAKRSLGA
ncbi:MAG: ComEC/Rec2 family competence protein, partial [Patescibacteria group bacterium]